MNSSKKAEKVQKALSLLLAIVMTFSQFGIVSYATEENSVPDSSVSSSDSDTGEEGSGSGAGSDTGEEGSGSGDGSDTGEEGSGSGDGSDTGEEGSGNDTEEPENGTGEDNTNHTPNNEQNNAGEGEGTPDPNAPQNVAQISGNTWIDIDKDNAISYQDGTLIATWKIAEGGKFSSVIITGDNDKITVSEPGTFTFDSEECSLANEGNVYTLEITNPKTDITIAVYGESEVPVAPIHVKASGNEWIEMDQDTGLTIENGEVTAIWSIKTDGKLTSVTITNEDGTLTVTDPGEFTFLEQPCSLEQAGSTYTLHLTGLTKDTEIKILGASALPETVTLTLNTREELLVVEDFQPQYQGPGGSDFSPSFQFVEGVVPNSFTVKVGENSNTISLTPGDFVVGDQTYNLELTEGPTGRPVYVIHLTHLIADAEITPNIQQTVDVSVNDPSRVMLTTGSTLLTADYGSTAVEWDLADKNKLNEVTVSVGSESTKLTDDGSFSVNGVSGSLSSSGSHYTLTINDIHLPVVVSISASDDVTFGGFELSEDKSLLPFKPESGSQTNSAFGFTVSYQTREDGSVLITHNAANARYHGARARLISQSHRNGEVIEHLTSPITVTVTVQCTRGCGKMGTASVTIPYRQINVEFQDELGNILQAPEGFTTSGFSMDNRTYEFTPPAISWYEYIPGSATLNKTAADTALLEENDKVYFALDSGECGKIILKYRAKGRVNFTYEDELGNPIYFDDAQTSVDGYRNDSRTVTLPTDEWYDFVSAELTTQGNTPSGSITSQDSSQVQVQIGLGGASTVEVKYRAKALVNVKYVDEQGNPIDDLIPESGKLTQVAGYRGETSVIPTPDVPNYEYRTMRIQTDGSTPSGSINTGTKTLTLGFEDASTLYVVYQPKASVNIRYVDDRGNPIDVTGVAGTQEKISGLRGEVYEVNTPDIEHYTFERMYLTTPGDAVYSAVLNANTHEVTLNKEYASTVTVVYRAKASFTIEYIDDHGNTINDLMPAGTPFSHSGHRDDVFDILTPIITDYDFISMEIVHPEVGGVANESATLDPNTHKATMKAGYNSIVKVYYHAKGSVAIQYKDELGSLINFEGAPESTSGYRDVVNTVTLPQHPYYEFDRAELATTSQIPSGAITEQDAEKLKVQMLIGDDSTITVYYKAKADVAIKYVDELGNPIDELMPEGTADMISGLRGQTFPVETPDMDDYVYEKMYLTTPPDKTVSGILDPEAKQLTMGFENASTVTVVYHAKASVNVRYVDELGTPIDDLMPDGSATIIAGLRGEHYTVAIPVLADYDFEQMFIITPEGSLESGFLDEISYDLELNKEYASTVTLVYHARASFKVEYIDDIGQSINDVIAAAVAVGNPFEYTGHRGDEFTIPTPELEDYQFNSMAVQSGNSVSLDTESHLATMNAGYDGVIYVKYDYRATVYLKYEDMNGNDISGEFDPANPTLLEGFRNRTIEIPHPDTGSYIFDHFEIETLPGEEPSGYLHGGQHDPTLTFGVREASTVTVVYRWIDLGIELKGVTFEGEPMEEGQTLYLSQGATFTWTVTNHGTAPCYPEVEFQFPDYLLMSNKTPGSTVTANRLPNEEITTFTVPGSTVTGTRVKLDSLLQPGESVDFITLFQVDTVDTYERADIIAVIPEYQQDKNGNSYPDIDLSNNKDQGELEILNPPIIMKKVNSEDTKERLEDCYIEIYDKNDELVFEGWSDKDGEWYVTGLYPGDYQVWERYAPEGFSRTGKWHTLTVNDDMTPTGRVLYNDPVQIVIKKVDVLNGNPLAGAEFGLYDENGQLIDTQTSGEDGLCSFSKLKPGNYTIEELKSPAGYIVSGKIIRVEITDQYINKKPYVVRNAPAVNTGADVIPYLVSPYGITVLGAAGASILLVIRSKRKKKHDEE